MIERIASSAGTVPHPGEIDGSAAGFAWGIPFAGLLLSIALLPLLAPRFWEHHFGKVAAFWTAAWLLPAIFAFGGEVAATSALHALLLDYVPFVLLLFALFVVAGGIRVSGNLVGTPAANTAMLAFGTLSASFLGTTGASMVLIRPMIRANADRVHKTHVFVFFIFLVANIGGALTPLGDPPLFLGFLKGVDFFWTAKAMLLPTLTATALLLVAFYVLDHSLWRIEKREGVRRDPTPDSPTGIDGKVNFLLLGAIVGLVLMSGMWKPDLEMVVYGTPLELQNLVRDVGLLAIAWMSWRLTPHRTRAANHFSFAPIIEVAKLFAGIFITITPAIAMLRAGSDGVLAPLVAAVSGPDGRPNDAIYFWLTGALSSFLDNAPTYLVFFNLAGGDAATLTGPLATTLVAISAGAVFMGANTYIGNAPNFMVKSIAESRGVRMPSFFAYLGWSLLVLGPIYGLLTLVFFA
jgi:Na+/H+ antiporter NhaD/arsenite permease-like protein